MSINATYYLCLFIFYIYNKYISQIASMFEDAYPILYDFKDSFKEFSIIVTIVTYS